jgi:urea-proton symporter
MDFSKMFPLFGSDVGASVLFVYAAIVLCLTWIYAKGYGANKESFLVARRGLGTVQGALSVGAAWVWAPGIFISAQQAYQNGLVGLFWFTIGNFLTLFLFGYFAKILRERKPDGFTVAGYFREKFSPRVQALISIEMAMLSVYAFAINVLAGSKSVEVLTGLDYHLVSVFLAGLALTYAFRNGLKASVVTEVFKLSVLWIGLAIIVPSAVSNAGGWDIVWSGLGGISGKGNSIFGTDFAMGVFMGIGLTTFIGHMGGPWGDNSFYQRAFAIEQENVRKAFWLGGAVFLFIPLMSGVLGFLAAGLHYTIPPALIGYTNVITVGSLLPSWCSMVYLFIIFAGLVSVLDSQLSSAANIAGHDVYERFGSENSTSIAYSRVGMLLLIVAGLILANWPGMTLQILFLFFGIMRACVWLPIMFSMWREDSITERGMFWGILVAYLTGFPMYVYGQYWGGGKDIVFAGTMLAVFGSGLIALLVSAVEKNRDKLAATEA